MRVILEIVSGSYAGRKILLKPGQVLLIGRTEQADYVIPHDARMSALHFALETDHRSCRIRDLRSSNGTVVNGERVTEATLRDGDEIVAGQTRFAVQIEMETANTPAAGSGPARIVTELAPSMAVAPSSVPVGAIATSLPFRPPLIAGVDLARPFDAALRDEDLGVRHEALLAAAWSRQKWVMDYCRNTSKEAKPENWSAIWLLAVLGNPSDLDRLLAIGTAATLGPTRFRALGTFGHPAVVETLLAGLTSKDARSAVAAAASFTKITGLNVDSENRIQLPPENGSEPNEFEREFLEEARLPDPELASMQWQKLRQQFSRGTRWCCGFDLSQGVKHEVLMLLDIESRWEACLRGRFESTWKGSPVDLDLFPQKRQ